MSDDDYKNDPRIGSEVPIWCRCPDCGVRYVALEDGTKRNTCDECREYFEQNMANVG